jgi:hypothetical protein
MLEMGLGTTIFSGLLEKIIRMESGRQPTLYGVPRIRKKDTSFFVCRCEINCSTKPRFAKNVGALISMEHYNI